MNSTRLTAKIKWLIDDHVLKIESNRIDPIFVYSNDIEEYRVKHSFKYSINKSAETELYMKYASIYNHREGFKPIKFKYNKDFIVENLDELVGSFEKLIKKF